MIRWYLLSAVLILSGLALLPAAVSAQTPLPTVDPSHPIVQCAVFGVGCTFSDPSCTFDQHFAGSCPQLPRNPFSGSAEPLPEPEPVPPPSDAITAPTNLTDVGTGIRLEHDGLNVQWYTLRLDGVYVTHRTTVDLVNGAVTLPFSSPLAPGTYRVSVEACRDTPDDACSVRVFLSLLR